MNDSMESDIQRLEQKANINSLFKPVASSDMLTVYYKDTMTYHHNHSIFCALIPTGLICNKSINDLGLDMMDGDGHPGTGTYDDENGRTITVYNRYGSNVGIEPLIIDRNFNEIRPGYREINEEFRLFHNLFYNSSENKYYKIDDSGDEETIAIVEENKIQIRLKEIQQFMAIKEMYLLIKSNYIEQSKYTLDLLGLSIKDNQKIKNKYKQWNLIYDDFNGFSSQSKSFSSLLGEFLFSPFPKAKSGMFGFEKDKPKKNVDFIIGEDKKGNEILIKYDSNKNYKSSGANNKYVNYLTPLDFKKTVLDKYYTHTSKYNIEDGVLNCGTLWSLQIDNHHEDKVCVWLGDITNLPYKEQVYWRSFNIVPLNGVSSVHFKRQFCCEFTDSDQPEHIFLALYFKLADKCDSTLSYRILTPLAKEDEYHLYSSIHVPTMNEQKQFDALILSLTKILVDSINEKELMKLILSNNETGEQIKGSINNIENIFSKIGIEKYEDHIIFLRRLQNLRSSSSAHRKGDNYNKIAKELGITANTLRTSIRQILVKSNNFLAFLIHQIEIGSFDKKELNWEK